jgi:CDP-glucose 4,6-dehydratase
MENLVDNNIDPIFWKNKKVFLTGHTGFKGSWMSLLLQHLGAKVKGYSLSPNTNPSLFKIASVSDEMISEIGDIRDLSSLKNSISLFEPEVVIHMAAQPLVRKSYSDPIETYSTNVMGTLNLLESCRFSKSVKYIVVITTDKCYENKEWDWGYRENEPMGGYDPYSSSKGCCELLVSSYRRSYFNELNKPFLATVRAGNVIGGGDWSEDRLIPDILKSFQNSNNTIIRNPNAIRPWQHVLEPLCAYLLLIQKMSINGKEFSEAWNFGPNDNDCKSVKWIVEKIIQFWGDNLNWNLDENFNPHEAKFLKLDISKAKNRLGWYPKLDLESSLKNIVSWHKSWIEGENMKYKTKEEIINYLKI